MMTEFYYGTSWHWPVPYLPRVMLSYNFTRTLKKAWQIEKPLMMDSGAFSVILKYGQYPYSPQEYAAGIEKWKPDIAWTMDYPCEPSVRENGKYNGQTYKDKIPRLKQYIENTERLLNPIEPLMEALE